jgi:hypothetical protein
MDAQAVQYGALIVPADDLWLRADFQEALALLQPLPQAARDVFAQRIQDFLHVGNLRWMPAGLASDSGARCGQIVCDVRIRVDEVRVFARQAAQDPGQQA